MKRREFFALIAGCIAYPFAAAAQQRAMPLIGFLSSRAPNESAGVLAAFYDGLRQSGFVEGQNVQIAFRWAEGHYEQLPSLAADLVGLPVTAIFAAGGPPSALAAKAKTSKIPIVFSAVTGPVELGLVASLNRPGGNVTGMSMFAADLWAKSAELLKRLVPQATVIAFLINPSTPSAHTYAKAASEAANNLGIDVRVINASTEQTIDEAFGSLDKLNVAGLVVPNEPFLDAHRDRIVTLAARHAIPTIYSIREYVISGGLISYGPSLADSYRQAGIYLGRILNGENPGDLPVQQPTKFELFINLKTAKVLGLAVPPDLLTLADQVIE